MKPLEDDEVALKLLHTADWHLGRRFTGFDEADALKLTRARLDVILRVLDLGRQYRVDGILCAGDLFDDPTPDKVWWDGLATCLNERTSPECPVFLLPGNHDPLLPNSVYGATHPFRSELPDHVHIIDRDDFQYELSDEAVIYAAPCRSRAGEKDLASSLPKREAGDDRIRIGLVHGQTYDMEGCELNFPIGRDAAKKRGLDYLAVGDTHGFREVPTSGGGPTVYPGAPEPTSFGEKDAGHAVIVFFARKGRRALIQKQRVAHWAWREETLRDLTALRVFRDTQDLSRTVLRLTLEMNISLEERAEVERILSELKGTEAARGRVGILQTEADGLRLDTTDIETSFGDLPDILQATVARLKAKEAGGEASGEAALTQQAQRALYHLYQVVQGGAPKP